MSERNDDFRRQLGMIWRLAQDGVQTVRDLAVWSSHTGRLRIDLALLQRERDVLYQQLGQQASVLIGDGRLQVPRPVRETYERIRELEARIRAGTVSLHDNAFGAPRGYEPEAAEDYNYGMTEGVDGDEEGMVNESPAVDEEEKPKAEKRQSGRTSKGPAGKDRKDLAGRDRKK